MRFWNILVVSLFMAITSATAADDLPNILLILADDLGYGDVGCYNPESKVPTPNIDRLAKEGMFAHDFDMEEVDMVFLEKSKAFLKAHAAKTPDKPFFLFHSAQAVHLPSFPGKAFKGKTKAGPHGDFIFEFDFVVGELMRSLKENGLDENTLVILSSDNGPEVTSVVNMRRDHQHDGARPWRGMKRDQWEGGHRVPMIVRWPGKIKEGAKSSQTTCLTDIMATCAAVAGAKLPNDAAEDSYDLLPAFLEKASEPIREYTIHQTMNLSLAIRRGDWKYLDHQGSGGNRYNRGSLQQYVIEDDSGDSPGQLYHLQSDPGETKNLYAQHPERVKALKAKLEEFKTSGRSAPER